MKRKRIELARIMLIIQMNHWIFVAAAVTILGMFGERNPHILLWLITGCIPAGLYFVRVRIAEMLPFFGIHLLLIGIGWGFPADKEMKALLFGMIVIYVIISVRSKLISKSGDVELLAPAFFVVIIGGITVVANFYTNNGWDKICFAIAMLYLVGYYVYYFMTEYLRFLEMNEKSAANIPEKELFVRGIKQTGIFSGIAVIAMLLSANLDWFSKIMSVVGAWVVRFLTWLLSGLGKEAIETEEEKIIYDQGNNNHMIGFDYSEAWYKFLEFLEFLYKLIAFVAMVAIMVGIVVSIFRFIMEHFHKMQKEGTKEILSNQDIREKCGVESYRKEKRSLFGFLNNTQKIRNLYRKRILQGKNSIIGDGHQQSLEYLTAKECCDKIEAANLKEMYEKARYSSKEITTEDVRMARK